MDCCALGMNEWKKTISNIKINIKLYETLKKITRNANHMYEKYFEDLFLTLFTNRESTVSWLVYKMI